MFTRTSRRIGDVIPEMFPPRIAQIFENWNDWTLVTAHRFWREEEEFCCIDGHWYKFVSRDVGYENDYWWYEAWAVEGLEQVAKPAKVFYGSSVTMEWYYPRLRFGKRNVASIIRTLINDECY
jgi:hypothetical protein